MPDVVSLERIAEIRAQATHWLESNPNVPYDSDREAELDAQHHNEGYDIIADLLLALDAAIAAQEALLKRAKALSLDDAVKFAEAGESEIGERLRWFQIVAALQIDLIAAEAERDAAQAERDEAQRRLSAAHGEADFHQQRTIFLEAELARLRAQGTDVASRLEMACKRMSVGSGARTRFEANRAGQREAYFASARLVRELFPDPPDTEGA